MTEMQRSGIEVILVFADNVYFIERQVMTEMQQSGIEVTLAFLDKFI